MSPATPKIDPYSLLTSLASAAFWFRIYKGLDTLTTTLPSRLEDIEKQQREQNALLFQESFAQHVYDYIRMKASEYDDDNNSSLNHKIFVYHPDTSWYPGFHRITEESEESLPSNYCGKYDDLDELISRLRDARSTLEKTRQKFSTMNGSAHSEESSPTREISIPDIVFHVLMPAWIPYAIPEPIHFPDDLQPLTIEGLKSENGRPSVYLNLPLERRGLLRGIGNLSPPLSFPPDTASNSETAEIVGTTVWFASNALFLAAGTGLGVISGLGGLVALPVWLGGNFTVGLSLADVAERYCKSWISARESPPRVLGSGPEAGGS